MYRKLCLLLWACGVFASHNANGLTLGGIGANVHTWPGGNIYYNFNDATIRPDARKDLEALYIIMNKFPDMEIELASHTDSRGKDEYNMKLSLARASNQPKSISLSL